MLVLGIKVALLYDQTISPNDSAQTEAYGSFFCLQGSVLHRFSYLYLMAQSLPNTKPPINAMIIKTMVSQEHVFCGLG